MSHSDSIPTNLDCVILGTGLTNSIVAAACSRIGKSVLHVDKNSYYGSNWASFTFQQLVEWITSEKPGDKSLADIPSILNDKSRLFCIDLCPRLIFSNGSMVDLLVKSNVSRYHEFKNNIRILSMIDGLIEVMPVGRNDVFNSPLLSNLLDKRRLMKFIENCIQYDPQTDTDTTSDIVRNADKPISKYLEESGFNQTLQEIIINLIAMVESNATTQSACINVKRFIDATRIYGKSPFMYPIYGCGEFPQSFCRLSAVFGGVYCLNTSVDDVKLPGTHNHKCLNGGQPAHKIATDPQREKFIIKLAKSNQEIFSNSLVVDHDNAIKLGLMDQMRATQLARAILITDKSIKDGGHDSISYLRIAPSDTNPNLVHLLEFNSSAAVCPPNLYLVYLWTQAFHEDDPERNLRQTVDKIFLQTKESIIWSFYYMQANGNQGQTTRGVDGLHVTSPPCGDIDYNQNIEEAREIFKKLCPDDEFLPRAPEPEEIMST